MVVGAGPDQCEQQSVRLGREYGLCRCVDMDQCSSVIGAVIGAAYACGSLPLAVPLIVASEATVAGQARRGEPEVRRKVDCARLVHSSQ